MGIAHVLRLEGSPVEGLREAWGRRELPPGPTGVALVGPGGPAALAQVVELLDLQPDEAHYRHRPGPGYEVRVWSGLRHLTASALVVRGGRVLLLKHRTKGVWLPPGGHVEPNETPEEAVVREVWEEAGIEVRLEGDRPLELHTVAVGPGHEHVDLVFAASPVGGRAVPGIEAVALAWFGPEELARPDVPANVAEAARRALAGGTGPQG